MAVVTLSVGFGRWVPGNESSWHTAQTMIFTTVVFLQLGQSLAVRSTRDSLFKQGFLSNPALIGAVLFMIILQMMVIYIPVFQPFFGTKSLTIIEFILCVLAGSMVFWAVEIEKLFLRTMVKRSGERM